MISKIKESRVQGVLIAHLINIVLLVSLVNITQAQEAEIEKISDEEYEIINLFVNPNKSAKSSIYKRTYSDKGWAINFSKENLDLITSRVGLPMGISGEELGTLLTDEVCSEIRNAIYDSKPLELDKSRLNDQIKLTYSFDKDADMYKVQRISKPIIIGDIAVYRRLSFTEAPIFILQKANGNWKVIYTFYDWLIIND